VETSVSDILEAITTIQDYTAGMDLKGFVEDRKTVDAVIRNFMIIGEAANHVPDSILTKHPEIPWREMRDMRNIVVHEYFGVSDKILWETVQSELPSLILMLHKLLEIEN
jgi:uncharacterized protein with HEPN domain